MAGKPSRLYIKGSSQKSPQILIPAKPSQAAADVLGDWFSNFI
jgi:hypothetical protein